MADGEPRNVGTMTPDEGPLVTSDDWMALVARTLRGRDLVDLFSTTRDGIEIRPLYTEGPHRPAALVAADPRRSEAGWDVRQHHMVAAAIADALDKLRREIAQDLAGGVTSVELDMVAGVDATDLTPCLEVSTRRRRRWLWHPTRNLIRPMPFSLWEPDGARVLRPAARSASIRWGSGPARAVAWAARRPQPGQPPWSQARMVRARRARARMVPARRVRARRFGALRVRVRVVRARRSQARAVRALPGSPPV